MAEVTPNSWRPSSDLRRSVWLTLIAASAAGWVGFTLLAFELEVLAAVLCGTLLIAWFLLHVRSFQLLDSEPGLEGQERARLESQLKFFGPAGIVVLAWRCLAAK